MTAALLALALILSVLLVAVLLVTFYEVVAVRNRADEIETISSYWSAWHRGRLLFVLVLGFWLTLFYVFLMGDLVFEWW